MSSPSRMKKSKLRLLGSLAALLALALAVSCTGFFQNPTVSSITVDPPNPSVSFGSGSGTTQQMTAVATYSDGSTGTLSGGTSCTGSTVCWSSSDTTIATISTGGLLSGVAAGTSTITAASGSISATATATVLLSNVTDFQVCEGSFGATGSCSTGSTPLTFTIDSGTQANFIAQGSSGGQAVDLTLAATWTMTSTAPASGGIQCSNASVSPEACAVEDDTTPGTYDFSVTYGTTTPLTATLAITVP